MATLKEIKERIKSVDDIQKVTNAMYLVSAAKYHSVKDRINDYSEYYAYVKELYNSVMKNMGNCKSPFLENAGEGTKTACIVIASDKGLAGDYNKSVARKAEEFLTEYPETEFFVIGAKVKQYFDSHGTEYNRGFDFTLSSADDETIDSLSDILIKMHLSGEYSEIHVIFTGTDNSFLPSPETAKILPLETPDQEFTDEGELIPSKQTLIDEIVPLYFRETVRNIVFKAFSSEQNERMTAMKSANDNAKDLLGDLSLQYNHQRQNAITREIIEISSERKKQ